MKRILITLMAVAAFIGFVSWSDAGISADEGYVVVESSTTTAIPDTQAVTTTTVVADTQPVKKVFVCKYVGTPGDDERLQTGQNPISVSVNAIPDPPGPDVQPGDEFADAQGRSVVIAFDVGQPEPDVSECPSPQVGTTTTSTSTTSTTSTSTTSTTSTTVPDTTSTTTSTVPGSINTTVVTPPSTTTTTTTTTPPTVSVGTAPVPPSTTTTTLPPTFQFSGASTICIAEVPTIRIVFGNALPTLAGQTGTLTMTAVNGGAIVGTQPLVYAPGTTVDILYPGTSVNADGSIADVPGWILQPNGLWVLDPSDSFLRDGIVLTYTVNPTATATITYPPESAACASPENPPPGLTPAGRTPPGANPGTTPPPAGTLPSTGAESWEIALIAAALMATGVTLMRTGRRKTL